MGKPLFHAKRCFISPPFLCTEFYVWIFFCFQNRWVKFEENVEEGGNRWSKPFVASLPLYGLMELRSYLTSGLMILDTDATNLLEVWNEVIESWIGDGSLEVGLRDAVLAVLLQRHKHQSQRRIKPSASKDQDGMTKKSLSGFFRSTSSNLLERIDSGYGQERCNTQNSIRTGESGTSSPNTIENDAVLTPPPPPRIESKVALW